LNGLPLWANTTRTQLKDGAGQTIAGTYTRGGGQTWANNAVNSFNGQSTLQVNSTDPLGLNNNPGDRAGFIVNTNWDNNLNTTPGFVYANAAEISNTAIHGLYNYGNLTFTKSTFIGLNIIANYQAAGQKNALATTINCYSKGDCSTGQQFVTFANYPINGDEGTGFSLVSRLSQLSPTQLAQVTSTSKNTCNTTLTQAVTGSFTAQTVNVASSTGCTVGTWIVVNREVPNGSPNHEALQITATTPTSITGIFMGNYNNGMAITPALDVHTNGGGTAGEGRVLVNISATPHTTGLVTGLSGGGLIGTGTGWSNTMLTGGDAINPGCMTMTADDYSQTPFGAGNNTLHSYFQIYNLTDATHLGVWAFSAAGSTAYLGKGPGSGAYRVLPCSEVLRIASNFEVILADTGFTWNNGDTIEYAIPPYPDVTGFQWYFNAYTNGGTYRSIIDINNTGARKFGIGLQVREAFGPIADQLPGADNNAYGTGFYVEGADVGINIASGALTNKQPTFAAIQLVCGVCGAGGGDNAGRINWGGGNIAWIAMNSTNGGMDFKVTTDPGSYPAGALIGLSFTKVGGLAPLLKFVGMFSAGDIGASTYTFGQIPACSSTLQGAMISISDANTTTWGATVTAGFSTGKVLIRCNGTNWTVVGA
jgi:hypothetical protein